jgi:hypothetical protein
MKLLVLLIILFSLYLIYRLSFPKQAGKSQGNETIPPQSSDGYKAVIKNRFVLPDRSNSAQHDDRKQDSDKQDENASIFAVGNANMPPVAVPSEELDDVFAEDVKPEDLDIEPDANETDNDSELDADEEVEEIRQSAGEIEGYAEGFTYDELATVIHEADKPEAITKAALETLRDLSQTDMFEKLVSGDTDRAARIASILDRSEQSIASQDEDAADDKDNEYKDFDIMQFLS